MSYALTAKQYLFTNKCLRFIYHWTSFACCIGMIHPANGVCLEGVYLALMCWWRLLHQCHVCAQPESLPIHTAAEQTCTWRPEAAIEQSKRSVNTCKWFVILGKVLCTMKYLQNRSLIVHHCSLPRGQKTYLKERADERTLWVLRVCM